MPPQVLEAAAALVEMGVEFVNLHHGECIIADGLRTLYRSPVSPSSTASPNPRAGPRPEASPVRARMRP
jgi:hypothetical protein